MNGIKIFFAGRLYEPGLNNKTVQYEGTRLVIFSYFNKKTTLQNQRWVNRKQINGREANSTLQLLAVRPVCPGKSNTGSNQSAG